MNSIFQKNRIIISNDCPYYNLYLRVIKDHYARYKANCYCIPSNDIAFKYAKIKFHYYVKENRIRIEFPTKHSISLKDFYYSLYRFHFTYKSETDQEAKTLFNNINKWYKEFTVLKSGVEYPGEYSFGSRS